MVGFGTWAYLTRSTGDPGASTSALIAVGGAAVMVIGIAARGDSPRAVAKARRILGGVGLVVAPVAGVLSLLELGTSPSSALAFLLVALAALALWAQAIALQVGLSFRVSVAWLTAALLSAAIAFAIAGLVAAGVGAAVTRIWGDSLTASAVGSAVALGSIAAILRAWATNRPDRQAVPAAVRRAVFGKTLPGDGEVLAAGPGPILRRQPEAAADMDKRDARLFALDSRLRRPPNGPSGQPEQPVTRDT